MTHYLDPGTSKGCAVATSCDGRLAALSMWQGPQLLRAWGGHIVQGPVIWEKPVLYPNELKRSTAHAVFAKANDLIAVAACGADTARALAGGHPVVSRTPRELSGQLPKPIKHGRALGRLDSQELTLVVKAADMPLVKLGAYVSAAALRFAKTKKVTGYAIEIVDLLDAISFFLKCEGRL